jgi:hypothetical protein
MHPFSYTSLKIIHDQKIQEALEQQRLYRDPGLKAPSFKRRMKSLLPAGRNTNTCICCTFVL